MALIHQFLRTTMTVGAELLIRGYIPSGTWVLEHVEVGSVSSTGSAAVEIRVTRDGRATKLVDGSVDSHFSTANCISWDGDLTCEFGDVITAAILNGTVGDVYELDMFLRKVAD